eukprot:7236002-Pyramimonas_sp.AAC.1
MRAPILKSIRARMRGASTPVIYSLPACDWLPLPVYTLSLHVIGSSAAGAAEGSSSELVREREKAEAMAAIQQSLRPPWQK